MTTLPQLIGAARHRAIAAFGRPSAVVALAEGETAAEPSEPSTTSADVYLFGSIGGFLGVTAKDFVRDVGSLDVERIVLHLNTPGGDALEGVAIANVLRAHKARIEVRVDGMAASAGSVIAMAGDEIIMGIGSQMMVHDPWGITIGNAAEVAAFGRRLDATGDSLASTLAAKAGGTTAEWREVMRAETWYTADEAVAAGLADRVAAADETGTAEGEQITPGGNRSFWDLWDSIDEDAFDLSAFAYQGRQHAPAPAMPGRQTPAAAAVGTPEGEGSRTVAFSDEQLTTMRRRLGLAVDADEATIVAALGEALDEQAAPAATARPALPEGVVTIEAAALEQLQTDARAGRDALARQQRDDRERLVAAAVNDGRIPPARREAWVNMLAADSGAAETLASLPKGLVPVGEPTGHDGNDETAQADLVDLIWGAETSEKGA
ncbi:head maturation protease, ClpP-related [Pseudonocardia sp. NPDC049635]|uniref:head maturation protease, ClpP-related n=1 Tax=Pseudonocardia sp. NPDC049635 TaxID=3155506 RepID=UPI0033D10655